MEPEKKPNFFDRVLLFIADLLPMHALGVAPGVVSLILRRNVMQNVNLYAAPLDDKSRDGTPGPDHRTPEADGNDSAHYTTGTTLTPFGRNMPSADSFDPESAADPPVQLVAAELLQRTGGLKPAGDQLNVLAAAWIQAMAHDWFGHVDSSDTVELDKGTPQCPLKKFRFKKTARRDDGTFANERTHWWDASFVYGQDTEAVTRARTHVAGRLIMSDVPGALPRDEGDGATLVGDAKNGWLGVALLQDIFLREHNAIADAIINRHPELKDDDDKVFNYARLAVAAIIAKIHTVDWTVELLKTDTLDVGMNSNWYGLPKALGLPFSNGPPGLFSLVASDTENHGVPFCLTEEFVSVYRLHPLLPDGLLLSGDEYVPLDELVGQKGDEKLNEPGAGARYWDSMTRYPCGNLELFNYPKALRAVSPTDDRGRDLGAEDVVDLAAIDLYRDRERGIRRYNDFRRGLFLKPVKSIAELCGSDAHAREKMEGVYGKDGIEKVDLQVGMLAEKKMKGFAISETAFVIFLLMASRRLEADRFFTNDFNEKTYGDVGFAWVGSVTSMRDVLQRHFPDVAKNVPAKQSAFKPYAVWPDKYLK